MDTLIKVGFVRGWENDVVHVAVSEKYIPEFGDLLYARERQDNTVRTILMEVVGFESQAPGALGPVETQPTILRVQERVIVKARLFIEISKSGSEVMLVKASKPPSLLSPVYLIRRGDAESEEIMNDISRYSYMRRGSSSKGIGAVVLRSGVAHNELLAQEKHFMNASFSVELPELLRKHVLVAGQTASGKTSGVQGLLLKYALESSDKIGWLVIDRHGEYTPSEGYVKDRFIGMLVDSIALNTDLGDDVKVYTYRLIQASHSKKPLATIPGRFDIKELPIKASSVTFSDFAALEEVGLEKASLIEEFLNILVDVFKYIELGGAEKLHSSRLPIVKSVDLFMHADQPETSTANMLALIPLLADNMVRYEGVGLPRKDKKGLHKVLVDRGIDARITRTLRRLILSIMGWRVRIVNIDKEKSVVVLDDSRSIVKVSPTLKDPQELPCLLEAISHTLERLEKAGAANYKWKGICKNDILEVKGEEGLDVDEIVEHVDRGNVVILDVSSLSTTQADLLVLTVARRLFEYRLELGVEESKKRPVISIVSEEAPLYLSPEKVKSPFNPFARIAREGRKFGIGLLAITQLATMIEKQLLGNFNTFIVMRTRSRGDIEFFRDLGIRGETLPFLGDRECFIYTPDLPIKEPIPVYMPAWFDEEYRKLVEERRGKTSQEIKVSGELAKVLELGFER
ncbi:MAG: DUF87 domain-containing protein [Desulfurococcaceae archaeon]